MQSPRAHGLTSMVIPSESVQEVAMFRKLADIKIGEEIHEVDKLVDNSRYSFFNKSYTWGKTDIKRYVKVFTKKHRLFPHQDQK